VNHAAPVAAADEVAFDAGQAGSLEGRFGIVQKAPPMIGANQIVKELVEAVAPDAGVQRERIGSFDSRLRR
jgi:hypothetical protein